MSVILFTDDSGHVEDVIYPRLVLLCLSFVDYLTFLLVVSLAVCSAGLVTRLLV